ncbi:MAG: DNA topoisomerase VI subunit B [Candidatus Krumholzibacteriota bacterium]|nr:DNA topoisomerase VI subunit B [Candidatus Krumholzibacteriota bacterium]
MAAKRVRESVFPEGTLELFAPGEAPQDAAPAGGGAQAETVLAGPRKAGARAAGAASRGKKTAVKKPARKTAAKKDAKQAAEKVKGKTAGKAARKAGRAAPEPTADAAVSAAAEPGAGEAAAPRRPKKRNGQSAEQLAREQREISISEFFTKNRHLLGFDNPTKALLTTVKEAVDNSLDACEDAGVLPVIRVEARQIAENRYKAVIEDNGPGIVRTQIPKIFGKLLYGSKFHTLKQSRGQQGIGISAAGMYGQLTTGKPVVVTSRTGSRAAARRFEVKINTRKNEPIVTDEREVDWPVEHGTRVEIELEAIHKRGKRSIDDYLAQTAIANPHLELTYVDPGGDEVRYPRVVEELPAEARAIKPHPYGVELGALLALAHESRSRNLRGFLQDEFSRVGPRVADEILAKAMLSPSARPRQLKRDQAEQLLAGITKTKIMNPPTNCLSPIGAEELEAGLRKVVAADFFAAVSRRPAVYRGNPFLVEAALAWGVAGMAGDDLAVLHRFANRVPLQYQQGACAMTKAVLGTGWKSYGLGQAKGALPAGPLVVLVHIASAWVPFTSESKEAVAAYPEILKEIKLALQDCGRRLGRHIRRGKREVEAAKKHDYIASYIPHIGAALREILGLSEKREQQIIATLTDTLERSRKF